MDADVRRGLDRTQWNQWLNNAWVPALCICQIDMRQRGAAHCDRHRMEAGVAGFKVRRTIVRLVPRWGAMMLVRSEPVVVLRMIVIGVQVDVQRRDLAGGRSQDQSEQDCHETVHDPECM